MKTVLEINQLTKGFTVTIKNQKGLIEAYVFESSASMGEFVKEYFNRPIKPRVIRRRKGLVNKTLSELVNGDSMGVQ